MVSPGILLIDKPGGLTSHDVVARTRRAFGTRKVGHAGTLDPMATGLLVLGIEGATRLLTYIVGADKTYTATIRLGAATTTDDAEGETVSAATPDAVDVLTAAQIAHGIADLTGAISQVPSSVSAIKVDGRRAYDRVRAGEEVELAARQVTIARFDLLGQRRVDDALDLDVIIDCSSGTYIRALARDLGAALGVGGHLTALRRTRVGGFEIADAHAIDELDAATTLSPAAAAARIMPALIVSADEARDLRHGKRLQGQADRLTASEVAGIDPDGTLVGILEARGRDIKSAMNMPEVQE
ncbi:tRNA pseudouridine synthase B [Microbacterium esteraromaticum]|uniref:tRNA pseudouridine synthase B n=1 Tax=Microbacterium esteraromaticum TaxID=57043 RepID=A0A1R4JJL0_9MICO|nr:tRNA pseudouridine(55) synthase TruB [Microbacterium esteraromaticum]SJN32197.1 tRNA pseudouridine synthase B [Microbacterium esteraromaticum]